MEIENKIRQLAENRGVALTKAQRSTKHKEEKKPIQPNYRQIISHALTNDH